MVGRNHYDTGCAVDVWRDVQQFRNERQFRSVPRSIYLHWTGTGFQLTFHGANWHRLEIGTYSDGSALAEFASEEFGSYLIVFNNRELQDINEHMHDAVGQWIDGGRLVRLVV